MELIPHPSSPPTWEREKVVREKIERSAEALRVDHTPNYLSLQERTLLITSASNCRSKKQRMVKNLMCGIRRLIKRGAVVLHPYLN